jgi:transposase
VATLFLLDEDTISKWRNKYRNRRLLSDWLACDYRNYDGKLTHDQHIELEHYVETEMVIDAATLVAHIEERYGKIYTVNGVTKLLHRLGFVYKQTTLIPGKLNEGAQAIFAREYNELKSNLKPDQLILFADGVHPSHNVHATKAWIKKGQEKQVPTNTGRKRLNINGALNLTGMNVTTYFSDTINTEETIHLLDKIQATYPDKTTIYFIADNARYYKNKDIRAYLEGPDCRIKIMFLPPYSSNLNFIERLWRFLKKYIIGIKRRQSFKQFETDIHAFFDHFSDYEDALRQFIGTKMHMIQLAG